MCFLWTTSESQIDIDYPIYRSEFKSPHWNHKKTNERANDKETEFLRKKFKERLVSNYTSHNLHNLNEN